MRFKALNLRNYSALLVVAIQVKLVYAVLRCEIGIASDRRVHYDHLLLFRVEKNSRSDILSVGDSFFHFFRDLRAMELLTSTVSTKRIINSIFISLQFFISLVLHSSTSFKFIHIFFQHWTSKRRRKRDENLLLLDFFDIFYRDLSSLTKVKWTVQKLLWN